ncbi:MAG: PD-(D/E)XK nuclease family protein [Spirochaetaceae bacterium]|nr:MAG: PD-(D/E)XK nuclease family protein [Spirochaetaceae bacterium]
MLVFPSEVVARFWRRRAVQQLQRRAVSHDRIISWDAFKERVFEIRSQARPVNATLRRIFAAALLHQNRERPCLRAVVDPRYSANSAAFVGLLQRILPSLRALADRGALQQTGEPLLYDLALIYDRYRSFLQRAGLFEPGWHRAGIAAPEDPHVIVFPDLIADYAEFAGELERHATISTISTAAFERGVAPGAAASVAVREYVNAHREVHAVLAEIEALLDQGIAPEEIVVSVAEPEAHEPFLQRYAELHAIPMLFRRGRPLSDSAAGRFFRALSTAVSSGFAFNALRGLLLDQAVPWGQPRLGRELIRAAVDAGCLKAGLGSAQSATKERHADDEWLRAIAAAAGDDRAVLRRYYLGVRDSLNGIAAARSAAELRQRLIAFVRRFLDGERWDTQSLNVYQRALDELKQLVAAESALGQGVTDAFVLWLGLLEQTPYVQQSNEGGVAVFPYRVAAGMRPGYHFVINASHDGTRIVENPFTFVREDLRERLDLPERDFSHAFLRAYRVSGESVNFSYSLQSFAGPRFAAGGLADRAEPAEAAHRDPYRDERELWAAGLEQLPQRLYRWQSEGLLSLARTGLRRRDVDLSRQPVAPGSLRARLLERSTGGGPLLSLSASRIDSYRSCPFGYLLAYSLRIEQTDFAVIVQPALAVGSYQHAVLESLYQRIARDDALVRPERLEHYVQMLSEVLQDESLLRSALRALPRPVIELVRRITSEGATRLLHAELEQPGRHRIEQTELSLSRRFDQPAVELTGRIDRLGRHPDDDSYILVDYKRRGSARRSQVVGRGGDPSTITTVQLPVYMLLLEGDGRRVERAYYYQVERGRIVTILSPDPPRYRLDENERQELLDYVERVIETVAAGLRNGDYRFPDPVTGCDTCHYRGICRARFAVE